MHAKGEDHTPRMTRGEELKACIRAFQTDFCLRWFITSCNLTRRHLFPFLHVLRNTKALDSVLNGPVTVTDINRRSAKYETPDSPSCLPGAAPGVAHCLP